MFTLLNFFLSLIFYFSDEPIILHQYNKVACDLRETAEVVCRVQAYPRPEFQWNYGTNAAPLLTSSEGHYELNMTTERGDIYTSILRISNIHEADYGQYMCRVANSLGTIRTGIHLQPKGPPERPSLIKATEVGHSYVTLVWEPGFDGGHQNTKFFVSYRRVLPSAGDELTAAECYGTMGIVPRRSNGELWQEFDCQRNNPCNVTSLEQHHTYVFKVSRHFLVIEERLDRARCQRDWIGQDAIPHFVKRTLKHLVVVLITA
jgi:echinoid protein